MSFTASTCCQAGFAQYIDRVFALKLTSEGQTQRLASPKAAKHAIRPVTTMKSQRHDISTSQLVQARPQEARAAWMVPSSVVVRISPAEACKEPVNPLS